MTKNEISLHCSEIFSVRNYTDPIIFNNAQNEAQCCFAAVAKVKFEIGIKQNKGIIL